MKFEMQTHGSTGEWSPITDCKYDWLSDPASTWDQAAIIARDAKESGYGVRLYADGILVIDAPWQVPIDERTIRFCKLVGKTKTREQVLRLDRLACNEACTAFLAHRRGWAFDLWRISFHVCDERKTHHFGAATLHESVRKLVDFVTAFEPEPDTLAEVFEALRDCMVQLDESDEATHSRYDFSDDYNNFVLTISHG